MTKQCGEGYAIRRINLISFLFANIGKKIKERGRSVKRDKKRLNKTWFLKLQFKATFYLVCFSVTNI